MDPAKDTWTVKYAAKKKDISELDRLSDVCTRYADWIDRTETSATEPSTKPHARITDLIQGQIDRLTTKLDSVKRKVKRQKRSSSKQDDTMIQSSDREISRLQIERGAMSEDTD